MCYRWMSELETLRWVDIFDELLQKYNDSFHRALSMTPNQAELDENKSAVARSLCKYREKAFKARGKKPKYQVGDLVRYVHTHTHTHSTTRTNTTILSELRWTRENFNGVLK